MGPIAIIIILTACFVAHSIMITSRLIELSIILLVSHLVGYVRGGLAVR